MIGTFAYLLFNTTRNRWQSQLRRLRTPRYAIGFVLGVLYFWGFLGRGFFRSMPRAAPSPVPLDSPGGIAFATLAAGTIAVVVAGIWIFGGDVSALAFSEAEVSMLLTAPVPRRTLILYKLAQSQIIILINVLIWTLILRRGSSSLPGVLSAIGIWAVFTTLNLHRMGSSLSRASQVEYRAAGAKKKWLARLFGGVVLIVVFAGFILMPLSEIKSPDGDNPLAFMHTITLFLASPGVQTALYPFHLVVAPLFARSAGEWSAAMLPSLAIVLLHVWWVLRSDTAFEEAAALASTERAKRIEAIRARKGATFDATVKPAGTFALASTGNRAIAIVWKNAIALRRTIKPGALLRLPIFALVASAGFGLKSGDPARWIAGAALLMGIMLPLFGIQVLRNDLRSDMMHLPFLKSLPIAGADLVLAEVASGAVPMAAAQLFLFAAAGVAFSMSTSPLRIPAGVLAGTFIALPVTLLALDGAICTLINGSAVLFPAWIRLGPSGPGGVEMMGQMMLSMIASLLAFLLLLLVPVALGGGAWFVLGATPAVATTVACLLGALTLAAESYGIVLALGRAFERAEPLNVT